MKGLLNMKRAAFFDIDNTLYPGTLAVDFARQLKLNPESAKIMNSLNLSPEADVVEVLKALQKSGMFPYQLYREVAEQTFQNAKNKFFKFSLELFQHYRREGYALVALSQAPFAVLKRYCQNVAGDSFDVIISPMPTTKLNDEGVIVIGERSVISTLERSKADWLREISECYGFDLSESIAIGDSATDISMLEAVGGRKMAFNPDKELSLRARDEGWEIVVDSTIFKESSNKEK